MNLKVLIFSLLAVAGLTIFALSAVTVYALVGGEAVTVDDVLQEAPVQAEVAPASAPVIEYERANYYQGGDCPHSKMLMTQAPAEKTLEEQPLAQVGQ